MLHIPLVTFLRNALPGNGCSSSANALSKTGESYRCRWRRAYDAGVRPTKGACRLIFTRPHRLYGGCISCTTLQLKSPYNGAVGRPAWLSDRMEPPEIMRELFGLAPFAQYQPNPTPSPHCAFSGPRVAEKMICCHLRLTKSGLYVL
jgi:hypothetical protein